MSIGYVHVRFNETLACTRCSWTHPTNRFLEGAIKVAIEHDATHRTQETGADAQWNLWKCQRCGGEGTGQTDAASHESRWHSGAQTCWPWSYLPPENDPAAINAGRARFDREQNGQ